MALSKKELLKGIFSMAIDLLREVHSLILTMTVSKLMKTSNGDNIEECLLSRSFQMVL